MSHLSVVITSTDQLSEIADAILARRKPETHQEHRYAKVFWQSLGSLHEPLNRCRILRSITPADVNDALDVPKPQTNASY